MYEKQPSKCGYITKAEPEGNWRAWETTSDHRNAGTLIKRKAQHAPVLVQAEARRGQRPCPCFIVLGATGKAGKGRGVCGATKAFLVSLTKGESKGRKHLLSNKTRCWPFRTAFPFCSTNNVLAPFRWWRNRDLWSRSWSWWFLTLGSNSNTFLLSTHCCLALFYMLGVEQWEKQSLLSWKLAVQWGLKHHTQIT